MNISPVLITKNAAATIKLTLESLTEFSEVIILDTGSSDNTLDIARQFINVKIYKSTFSGFGKAKNDAAKFAKNDWIFSIDADEVMNRDLLNNLKKIDLQENTIYKCRRYNYYRNKLIKYSGWGKEYVIRLYNKKYTKFNDKLVHESLIEGGLEIKKIDGGLLHFSYLSISDFGRKRDFYSELFAIEYSGKRRSSPLMAFARATFNFIHTFFVRSAYMDGYRGLLIAVSNAHVTFMKYLKLYEANIDYKILMSSLLLENNLPVRPTIFNERLDKIAKIKLLRATEKVTSRDIENIKSMLTILN